ncbi:substance-K receptor-like [Dendronephthya gigantea]|uniref:substance-K receptor-like n=1 Tax=Dendronephthya gigantea TaxID=151771 RepID=UPI00106972C2|nr:substance-K receptor-like [Dendronephthya gigantea]
MFMELQGNLSTRNGSNTTAVNNTDHEIYNKLSAAPLFLTIYAVVFIVAVGGNCLVIWIMTTHRKLHEVTINYLLVNLAVADLIQTFSSIFHVADFMVKDLNIGNVGCKFQLNMFNIPYAVSVLTLTLIAYERYCAICKPVFFTEVKHRVRCIIPAIWLVSICVFIPTIIYCGLRMDTKKNQLTCDCTQRWPSLRSMNTYGIFLVVLLYVIPLVIISRLYFVVIRRLRRPIPGEQHGTVTTYQSRQGIYNVLYFLKRIEYDFRRIYRFVWYPALLLAFISCAFNPIIYCFLSKNFRKALRSIVCCVKVPKIGGILSSGTPLTPRRTVRTRLTFR